jgi:hypothetical protein
MSRPLDETVTSLNTCHGPAKSIITVPLEITKATGIGPWAGGVSGFTTAWEVSELAVGRPAESESAEGLLTVQAGSAAKMPKAADLLMNSLRFMAYASTNASTVFQDEG